MMSTPLALPVRICDREQEREPAMVATKEKQTCYRKEKQEGKKMSNENLRRR
jgi:hypothetical protein